MPSNTTGDIYIPTFEVQTYRLKESNTIISEDGGFVANTEGLYYKDLVINRRGQRSILLEVESGKYSFEFR